MNIFTPQRNLLSQDLFYAFYCFSDWLCLMVGVHKSIRLIWDGRCMEIIPKWEILKRKTRVFIFLFPTNCLQYHSTTSIGFVKIKNPDKEPMIGPWGQIVFESQSIYIFYIFSLNLKVSINSKLK